MLLQDKTILVTGAGRGIGHAIASAALLEGANVVAHLGRSQDAPRIHEKPDMTSEANASLDANRMCELYGDLTRPADLTAIWQQAVAWRGRVDVLINNAGVYVASPIDDPVDWDQGWRSNLSINLEAPATLCRLAIQHFASTSEGIIINMASRSSHRGDDAEHLAYGAAKGGLLALTKGIARSFANRGTLAYAVAPAWVRTEMAEAHIASVGEAQITNALPMQEITPPEDVAQTVIFLASGRARHATGCTIDITGADYVR